MTKRKNRKNRNKNFRRKTTPTSSSQLITQHQSRSGSSTVSPSPASSLVTTIVEQNEKRTPPEHLSSLFISLLAAIIFFLLIQPIFERWLQVGISRWFLITSTLITFLVTYLFQLFLKRSSWFVRGAALLITPGFVIGILFIVYPMTYPKINQPSLVILAPSNFSDSLLADRVSDALTALPPILDTAVGPMAVIVQKHRIAPGTPVLDNPLVAHLLRDENVFALAVLYESEGLFKIIALNPVDELLRKDRFSIDNSIFQKYEGIISYVGQRSGIQFAQFELLEELVFYVDPQEKFPSFKFRWEFLYKDSTDLNRSLQFSAAAVQEEDLSSFFWLYMKRLQFTSRMYYGDQSAACKIYLNELQQFGSIYFSKTPYFYDLSDCTSLLPQETAEAYWAVLNDSEEDNPRKMEAANQYSHLVLSSVNPINASSTFKPQHSQSLPKELSDEIQFAKELRNSCGRITLEGSVQHLEDFFGNMDNHKCVLEMTKKLLKTTHLMEIWKEIFGIAAQYAVEMNDQAAFRAIGLQNSESCEDILLKFIIKRVYSVKLIPITAISQMFVMNQWLYDKKTTPKLDLDACFDSLRKLEDAKDNKDVVSVLAGLRQSILSINGDVSEDNDFIRSFTNAILLFEKLISYSDSTQKEIFDQYLRSIQGMFKSIRGESYEGLVRNPPNLRTAKFGESVIMLMDQVIRNFESRTLSTPQKMLDNLEFTFLSEDELRRVPMYWSFKLLKSASSSKSEASHRAIAREMGFFLSRYPRWRYSKYVAVLVYHYLGRWEDIIAQTDESGDEFLKTGRAYALNAIGRYGEASNILRQLAEAQQSPWDKDIYLGMALNVLDYYSLASKCIGPYSRQQVDALEELFHILDRPLVFSRIEFRTILAALVFASKDKGLNSQMHDATSRARRVVEYAMEDLEIEEIKNFAEQNPGLLSAGTRLFEFADVLYGDECNENTICDQTGVESILLKKTNFNPKRLDADGCEQRLNERPLGK